MRVIKRCLTVAVLLCLVLCLATSALAAEESGTTSGSGTAYTVSVVNGTGFSFTDGVVEPSWNNTNQIKLPVGATSLTLATGTDTATAFTIDLGTYTALSTVSVGPNCTLTLNNAGSAEGKNITFSGNGTIIANITAGMKVTLNGLAVTAGTGGASVSCSGGTVNFVYGSATVGGTVQSLKISGGSVTLPDGTGFTADFGVETAYKLDDSNTTGFMTAPTAAGTATAVTVSVNPNLWTSGGTSTAKFGVSSGKVFTIKKNAANEYTVSVETTGSIVATSPSITLVSVSRTSESNAAVTFRSSKAGSYYYIVQESGESPSIDTIISGSVVGTCGVNTDTTIRLSSLSGTAAKTIYIAVKDNTGNISNVSPFEIPPLFTATVSVYQDGSLWTAGNNKSFRLVNGSEPITLTSSDTGIYSAPVPNGTWAVYDGNTDTGARVTVSNNDGSTTLNYYSVSFNAVPAGSTTSASISATYGGSAISSGAIVLPGAKLLLTASGNGATTYTYSWSGTGISTQTGQTLTITSLSGKVNATCTVTGQATPVISISTQPQGVNATYPNGVTLRVAASASTSASVSYQWQRSTNGSSYSIISGATSSAYTVPANTAAGTYYYRCVVSATGANSVTSNAAAVTIYKADFSSAPSISSAYATGSSGSVYLAWSASSPSAASYTVTAYYTNGSVAKTVTGITARNTTITGLSNGTAYNFRVTAVLGNYNDRTSASSSSITPSGGSSTVSIRSGTSSSTDIIGTTYSLGSPASTGYTAASYAKSLNIYNTGSSQLTGVTASLSSSSNFTITSSPASKISSGGSSSFTVRPVSGLSKGTYSATITVSADNATSQKFYVSFTVGSSGSLFVSTSSKASGTAVSKHTFDSAAVGYSAPNAITFYVHNNGSAKLTGVTATLSGTDKNSFTLTKMSSSSITSGSSQTFTVKPNTGLKAGTYTAAVMVSSDQADDYTVNLTFVVKSGNDIYIAEKSNGSAISSYTFNTAVVGYSAIDPVTLYICNNSNAQLSGVKVALSENDYKSFTLSKTTIGTVARNDYETFTVKPDAGLKAGTYTATLTVSSNQGSDYTVKLTFVVRTGYDMYVAENSNGSYITSYTFKSAVVGYSAQDAVTLYVRNNLKSRLTGVTATLSGTDKNSFTLTKMTSGTISAGDSQTFTVKPDTGLKAGTYTANVTITSDQADDYTVKLTFIVKDGDDLYITERKSGQAVQRYDFASATEGYSALAYQTFYVYNGSGGTLSGVKVSISGSDRNSFALGYYDLGTITNGGYETFTIAPKTGLAAGTYTAALTTSADNGAVTSMMISFTVKADETKMIPFYDVPLNAWYYNDVKRANELGLIDGVTASSYMPDNNLTVAQAVKLACCVHQRYYYGNVTLTNGYPNWYDSYVRYAKDNGIISADYEDYKAIITREEFVNIMYNALPSSDYVVLNNMSDDYIPDVKTGDAYYNKIFRFYQAGILTGSDSAGTFHPKSNIKRSEVASILTRIYDKTERIVN